MKRRLAAIAVLVLLVVGCRGRGRDRAIGAGDLVTALDDEGQKVELRVDNVEKDPKDDELSLYAVSIKKGDEWVPYCKPDIEGRSAAIPVQGSWSPVRGRLEAGHDTFTFACTSGAIGKCMRFGYKPWKTVDGKSLEPLHAACIRMVRADYCGDGHPHTVDGTVIDIHDGLGIQTEAPQPGTREELEAGWSPDGATFLAIPRHSDDVAAIVRECPEHFAAGRTSLDQRLDAAQVRARFPETVLFNNRVRKR